ncbi:MAG: hypothetical protein CUN57_03570, partial [Phototrophicales bacterium]
MEMDPNYKPSKFDSRKQQFERELNTNVWMTKNEVRHATSYFRYQTCVTTTNYVFVIGQYTVYDTMEMTSDVTDLTGIDYKTGQATAGQFTLKWNTDELRDIVKFQCPYEE